MKRIIALIGCSMLLAPVYAQTNLKTDSLTVTDVKTGLMWMRYDFSFLKKRFLNNWNECFSWQQAINNERYAGFNDWRVPSISEYRTINHSKADRDQYLLKFFELDTTCVWGKGAYSFWSKNEKGPYNASYISFIDGFATSGDKEKQVAGGDWEGISFGFSVRLVRAIKK
ncbi:Lcl C-terminal domain-containing protein [Ferruginibacter sp.]